MRYRLFSLVLIILLLGLGHGLPFLAEDLADLTGSHGGMVVGYLRTAFFLSVRRRGGKHSWAAWGCHRH